MVANRQDIPSNDLAAFCRKWGIAELALFGSILREDFLADSDVDVLITMQPGRSYGWIEYCNMKEDLERLFDRPVDLVDRSVVERQPNWIRRRAILSSAERIYAEG